MSAVDRGILAALRQARIAQMLGAEGEALSAPIIGAQASASDRSGQPYVLNDAFRAVHDTLGHGPMGAGFRAGGEENAFQHHASLYSDLARPAMTAETRGQNSFVNFSDRVPDLPEGDPRRGATIAQLNKGASGADTFYADQKSGIMPDVVYNRGLEWMGRPISVAQLRALVAKGGASGALAALILKGAEVDERTQTIRLPAEMAT